MGDKMKTHYTTVFSILVYILKNNYLIFTYLFIPLLMKDYQNTSYIAPLIFVVVCFLMILILPKKIGEVKYNEILNKSFIACRCRPWLWAGCPTDMTSSILSGCWLGAVWEAAFLSPSLWVQGKWSARIYISLSSEARTR